MSDKFDDYNFDDFDFDFDDPEKLGESGWVDSSKKTKARKAVTALTGGFVSGVKEKIFSKESQKEFIDKALPESYKYAYDTTIESMDAVSGIYDEAKSELAKTNSTAAKKLKPFIDKYETKIPQRLRNPLKKWGNKHGSSSSKWSEEDNEELKAVTTVNELFAVKEQTESIKMSALQSKVQTTLAKNQTNLLANILKSNKEFTSYRQNVDAVYKRKSLELQYRQFYVQRKLLETQEQMLGLQKSSFEQLVKNTGLPDFVKMHGTEMAKEMVIQKTFGSYLDKFGGIPSNIINTAGKNISKNIKAKLKDSSEIIFDMLDQLGDANDDTSELSPEDKIRLAGNLLGGMAGKKLTGVMAERFKKRYGNSKQIKGLGSRIDLMRKIAPNKLRQTARMGTGNEILDSILELAEVNKIFSGTNATNTVRLNEHKNLLDPAIYDNLSRKALTEIIPTYLSKIHWELRANRTGETNSGELLYDFKKQKWSNSKTMRANLEKDMYTANKQVINRAKSKYLSKTGIEGLTPELQSKFISAMLTAGQTGTSFTIAEVLNEQTGYMFGFNRKELELLRKHFEVQGHQVGDFSGFDGLTTHLAKAGAKQIKQENAIQDMLAEMLSRTGNVTGGMRDLAMSGQMHLLDKLTVLDRDSDGVHVDFNKVNNRLLGVKGSFSGGKLKVPKDFKVFDGGKDITEVLIDKDVLTVYWVKYQNMVNKGYIPSEPNRLDLPSGSLLGRVKLSSISEREFNSFNNSLFDQITEIFNTYGPTAYNDLVEELNKLKTDVPNSLKNDANNVKNNLVARYEAISNKTKEIGTKGYNTVSKYVSGKDIKVPDIDSGELKNALFGLRAAITGNYGGKEGKGYSSGGYTGSSDEDTSDPAGIVHKNEFVFNKQAVQGLGVGFLEYMQTHGINKFKGKLGSGKKYSGDEEVNDEPIREKKPKSNPNKDMLVSVGKSLMYIGKEFVTSRFYGLKLISSVGKLLWNAKYGKHTKGNFNFLEYGLWRYGSTEVSLYASGLKGGRYINGNGEVINKPADIVGDIYDSNLTDKDGKPQLVLSEAEYKDGLYDHKGKMVVKPPPSKIRKFVSKITAKPRRIFGNMAKGAARWGVRATFALAKTYMRVTTAPGRWLINGLNWFLQGHKDSIAQKPEVLAQIQVADAQRQEQVNTNRLLSGISMAVEKIVKPEKKYNDSDGDGDRDGNALDKLSSWREKAKAKASNIKEKVKEKVTEEKKKGSFLGKVLDTLTSGFGIIKGVLPTMMGGLLSGGLMLAKAALIGMVGKLTISSILEWLAGKDEEKPFDPNDPRADPTSDQYDPNYGKKSLIQRGAGWALEKLNGMSLTEQLVTGYVVGKGGLMAGKAAAKWAGKKVAERLGFGGAKAATEQATKKVATQAGKEIAKKSATQAIKQGVTNFARSQAMRTAGGFIARQAAWMGARAAAMPLMSAIVASGPIGWGVAALGALAVGAGYGLYKLYKNGEIKKAYMSRARIAAYGYDITDEDKTTKLVEAEQYLYEHAEIAQDGKVTFKNTATEDKLLEIFGVQKESNPDDYAKFHEWTFKRFMPVFVHFVTSLNKHTGSTDLNKIDEIPYDKMVKVLSDSIVKHPELNPYEVMQSPFSGEDEVEYSRDDVFEIYNIVSKQVKDLVANGAQNTGKHALKSESAKADKSAEKTAKRVEKNGWQRARDIAKEAESSSPNGLVSKAGNGLASMVTGTSSNSGNDASRSRWVMDMFSGKSHADRAQDAKQASTSSSGGSSSSQSAVSFSGSLIGTGTGGKYSDVPDSKGKGWNNNRDTILAAAKIVGVDPGLIAGIAAQESGFDPNIKARTSSATGLFQFLKDSWAAVMRSHASKFGIPAGTGPTDARASALLGAQFIKDNLTELSKIGAVQPGDAYLAHFAGLGGAKKVLKAGDSAPISAGFSAAAIRANSGIFGKAKTLGDVRKILTQKMVDKHKQMGVDVPIGGGASSSSSSSTTTSTSSTSSSSSSSGSSTNTNSNNRGNNGGSGNSRQGQSSLFSSAGSLARPGSTASSLSPSSGSLLTGGNDGRSISERLTGRQNTGSNVRNTNPGNATQQRLDQDAKKKKKEDEEKKKNEQQNGTSSTTNGSSSLSSSSNTTSDGKKILRVVRFKETNESTISKFHMTWNGLKGYILEPAGPSTTASQQNKRIPAGTYNVKNHNSAKFPNSFCIYNREVPASRAILIHAGSIPAHTKGCLLPGSACDNNKVSNSKDTVAKVYAGIREIGPEKVAIVIEDKFTGEEPKDMDGPDTVTSSPTTPGTNTSTSNMVGGLKVKRVFISRKGGIGAKSPFELNAEVKEGAASLPSGANTGEGNSSTTSSSPAGIIKQATGDSKFDVDKFVKTLKQNAKGSSIKLCAKYVRLALNAAGVDGSGGGSAYMYVNWLPTKGFHEIGMGSTPQAGDIVVNDKGYNGKSKHGHIQGYTGSQWISDFTQNKVESRSARMFRHKSLCGTTPVTAEAARTSNEANGQDKPDNGDNGSSLRTSRSTGSGNPRRMVNYTGIGSHSALKGVWTMTNKQYNAMAAQEGKKSLDQNTKAQYEKTMGPAANKGTGSEEWKKQPGILTEGSGNTTLNVDAFISTVKKVAYLKQDGKPGGRATVTVRTGLNAGGIPGRAGKSAFMYADWLLKQGFHEISLATPDQAGDIVVNGANFDGKNKHGHIQVYSGNEWLSDYRQNNYSSTMARKFRHISLCYGLRKLSPNDSVTNKADTVENRPRTTNPNMTGMGSIGGLKTREPILKKPQLKGHPLALLAFTVAEKMGWIKPETTDMIFGNNRGQQIPGGIPGVVDSIEQEIGYTPKPALQGDAVGVHHKGKFGLFDKNGKFHPDPKNPLGIGIPFNSDERNAKGEFIGDKTKHTTYDGKPGKIYDPSKFVSHTTPGVMVNGKYGRFDKKGKFVVDKENPTGIGMQINRTEHDANGNFIGDWRKYATVDGTGKGALIQTPPINDPLFEQYRIENGKVWTDKGPISMKDVVKNADGRYYDKRGREIVPLSNVDPLTGKPVHESQVYKPTGVNPVTNQPYGGQPNQQVQQPTLFGGQYPTQQHGSQQYGYNGNLQAQIEQARKAEELAASQIAQARAEQQRLLQMQQAQMTRYSTDINDSNKVLNEQLRVQMQMLNKLDSIDRHFIGMVTGRNTSSPQPFVPPVNGGQQSNTELGPAAFRQLANMFIQSPGRGEPMDMSK